VLASELGQLIPAALNRTYRMENGWLELRTKAQALIAEIETELNQ
jgi:hypothetical protein